MAALGNISLFIALVLAAYSAVGSFVGQRRSIPELVQSARYAVYLATFSLAVAIASLVAAFLAKDFQIEYVALNSNRAMSPIYTWVAFYAGNQGSLLFIAFALASISSVAVMTSAKRLGAIVPYATSIMMVTLVFFLAIMVFLANPFDLLPVTPEDGRGINPLLTHPGMFIHPPLLMTGLIAVTLPFAFAMGALLSGKVGDEWVDAGRVWGIFAWAVLGTGLLLGAWWAYTILGWGGYWAWDPVENAGFMPWVALTAFIHSIMVQKRRGMFRMWNISLIIMSMGLAQYGMFMNRSGSIPSVHSFAESALGWTFLFFMAVTLASSLALFFVRYNRLKSARPLESILSREVAFLANNLILLGIAFVTLWGVVFPLISRVFQGVTVTVGAPYYNQINGPLFLVLIFLMGVGPLLPWRHASLANVRKALLVPLLVAIGVVLLLVAVGINKVYALLAFGLCALVAASILQEWVRGTRSRHKRGESLVVAFVRLIAGNRPRYGGYIAHLSIILLAFGIVGSSFFNLQKDVILSPGERASAGDYDIEYVSAGAIEKSDRTEFVANVRLFRNGVLLDTLQPRRAVYPGFRIASTRAAIRSTPVEDFYLINSEFFEDGRAAFRILINPLVMLMWVAGPILILGTVVALWPQRPVAGAPKQGERGNGPRRSARGEHRNVK